MFDGMSKTTRLLTKSEFQIGHISVNNAISFVKRASSGIFENKIFNITV